VRHKVQINDAAAREGFANAPPNSPPGLDTVLVSPIPTRGTPGRPWRGQELRIETLVERIIQEMVANQSVIIGRAEIGAWSRA
jgi:hypothetical protein